MKDRLRRSNYSVYGLCIRSDWPLECPETVERATPAIELIKADAPLMDTRDLPDPMDSASQCVTLSDGACYVRWPGLMEFLVSADGRTILGHELDGDSRDTLQALFFGGVLSF